MYKFIIYKLIKGVIGGTKVAFPLKYKKITKMGIGQRLSQKNYKGLGKNSI